MKYSLLTFLLLVGCSAAEPQPEIIQPEQYEAQSEKAEVMRQQLLRENPERFEARSLTHQGRTVRYRWFSPQKPDKPLPLVIVLHGSSGKGNDNISQLLSGTGALGAGIWATPERQKTHPCFVVVPQCPPGEMWTLTASWTSSTHPLSPKPAPALSDLMALLDSCLENPDIDPKRVYLVGASMGGYGTFDWLVRQPHRFAAGIPVCGGMPEGQAEKLKKVPLWIFHGENDNIVPVEESRRAFSQIHAAGGLVRYSEFRKGGHQISTNVWIDPRVADWLFSQKK